MSLKIIESGINKSKSDVLKINAPLVIEWLIKFLRDECTRQRGVQKVVIGLSGGLDSAVVTYLCAKAFGSENVYAFSMPYKTSASESYSHAKLVADQLKVPFSKIEITAAVDGYACNFEQEITPSRLGNLCARVRAMVLFDQSAKLCALPTGTGNKSERLMGYYTWHADDSPPINPLGDLYKTQVFQLARELGVHDVILDKAPSADLVPGQTDEEDLGLTYERLDLILSFAIQGYSKEKIVQFGFDANEVERTVAKLKSTHWKRHLPTVAMFDVMTIGESYLRPVDY